MTRVINPASGSADAGGAASSSPGDQSLPSPADRVPGFLVGLFLPDPPTARDGLPAGAAEEIQRGRYERAAELLLADAGSEAAQARRTHRLVAADCLLLARRPEQAERLLAQDLPPEGIWSLACAQVQRNELQAGLESLASMSRHGMLESRREAAAALVAHLGLTEPPAGLADLLPPAGPSVDDVVREGYRRFQDLVVTDIGRHADAAGVCAIVGRSRAHCANLPPEDQAALLAPIYEAAVRTTWDAGLAGHGLDLLLEHPGLVTGDDAGGLRALLLATAAGRLRELGDRLLEWSETQAGEERRCQCSLMLARIALVEGEAGAIVRHAARAAELAATAPERASAGRLRRVAGWLVPPAASPISEWQLRELHHLLTSAVAERLDAWDPCLLSALVQGAGERSEDAAETALQAAVDASRNRTIPALQRALGNWTYRVAVAMREAARADVEERVAYAGSAWRLLGPNPPAEVSRELADAIGLGLASLAGRDAVLSHLDSVIGTLPLDPATSTDLMREALAAWERHRGDGRPPSAAGQPVPNLAATLRPVAEPPTACSLETFATALGPAHELSPWLRLEVQRCLADRMAVLPDHPPFRGRARFETDEAWRLYRLAREERDAKARAKAFEDAWTHEPDNHVTIQGVILGLRRRLEEQPLRRHVLERLARVLREMPEREVEAALAFRALAETSERGGAAWQTNLERAAAALQRRVHRRSWPRARSAQIVLHLELGDPWAAADAAWEESSQWLPGSELSTRFARLAAELWSRAQANESGPLDDRVRRAWDRSELPPLTNREAVQVAVEVGRLEMLSPLDLDADALEDLWLGCRGQEDYLDRFLQEQGTHRRDPHPHYLEFLLDKLDATQPAKAARIRQRRLGPDATDAPQATERLRLAAAELLERDPLTALGAPARRLGDPRLRAVLAELREAADDDPIASATFSNEVVRASDALFHLAEELPDLEPEHHAGHVTRARQAVEAAHQAAEAFSSPAVASIAVVVGRHLGLALERSTVEDYVREKEKRLIPSRLGLRLGSWYSTLRQSSGPLDFFHHHQAYEYTGDRTLAEWWESPGVYGQRVRTAAEDLLASLEHHRALLQSIEQQYRETREPHGRRLDDFGLMAPLAHSCEVLKRALANGAGVADVLLIAPTLQKLGGALRGCEVLRSMDGERLLVDGPAHSSPYLLPRAAELFGHWRANAGVEQCLRAMFEMRDEEGQRFLALICFDAGRREAKPVFGLRGLAPYGDIVEALGGQFHIWIARPGETSRCRRDHRACIATDYVERMLERLQELARTTWLSRRGEVENRMPVLEQALRSRQSANLQFALLPRLHGEQR